VEVEETNCDACSVAGFGISSVESDSSSADESTV
jgi:hypothetical protein